MKKIKLFVFVCALLLANAAMAQYFVNYTLAQAGKVSINVYDSQGKIVRTLLNAAQRDAGANLESWDGKDQFGNVAPAGSYTWKLLQTQGLSAKYLMKVGTSLPDGNDGANGRGTQDFGLGNQSSVDALTVDDGNIYAIAPGCENVCGSKKFTLTGTAIWGGNRSGVDIGILGETTYYLNTSGYKSPVTIYTASKTTSNSGNGVTGWSTGENADEYYSDGYHAFSTDLVAYDNGNNPQLILSCKNSNKVKWFDPTTGDVIDSVAINSPRGAAIESNGNILVITDLTVVRFSKSNKTLNTVIAGLAGDPFRLAVDRTNGDILLVNRGNVQQISRYSSAGVLKATYGKAGGRDWGLYKPADFRDVNSISDDGSGGFVISEDAAPRRIARFDAIGALVKEWYASTTGLAAEFRVEQDNPNAIWYGSDLYSTQYVRAIVDFTTKTYTVHSTYDISNLTGGKSHANGGTRFEIKKRNGIKYIMSSGDDRGNRWVAKFDEINGKIIPLSIINPGDYIYSNPHIPASQWTDANGDGLEQSSERTTYSDYYIWGNGTASFIGPDFSWCQGLQNDNGTTGGIGNKIPLLSWNSVGAPVYGSPSTSQQIFTYPADLPTNCSNIGMVYKDESLSSPVFGALHTNTGGSLGTSPYGNSWGTGGQARLFKWDSTGKLLWELMPKTSPLWIDGRGGKLEPGEIGLIADLAQLRTIKNVFIVPGKDGAWGDNGVVATELAWDEDGLWVGNLLGNRDLTATNGRKDMYQLSSEPLYIDVKEAPNGNVYFYGNWENHVRIWEVSGWDGWVRQNGPVVTGTVVTDVSLNNTSASIAIGGSTTLVATVSPDNATNKTVTWSSSNTAVATVNSSGLVTGVTAGTATITATSNDQNKTATCAITVPFGGAIFSVLTTQTPADIASDSDYELGMKFSSTQAGQIHRIRFYKAVGETGTHVGRIWLATGTQLASVTFTGETASGWQEMALASPLSILANTTYVVSVNANTNYVFTEFGLQNAITNGPLSSVADGVNGVENGTPGTFPTATWNTANYFRDVVFTSGTVTTIKEGQLTAINVYPNPVKDFITIEGITENAQFNIYNITGSLILSIPMNSDKTSVNISALKPNIYIYKIMSENSMLQTGKLAKE